MIKVDDILALYPFCGRISSCAADRGFGFIQGASKEEWFHITDNAGQRLESLDGLTGKACVFITGGNPKRYKQEKSGWYNSIIRWQLIGEDAPGVTPDTYGAARRTVLGAMSPQKLGDLLAAEWYLQLWQRMGISAPLAPLNPDQSLSQELIERLHNANGLEQLEWFISALCSSPWYQVNEVGRKKAFAHFFRPDSWPMKVFQYTGKVADNTRNKLDCPEFRERIGTYVRKARIVSIDLESDGVTVFQYGSSSAAGLILLKNKDVSGSGAVQKAVEKSLGGQLRPFVVGHNILEWDLPILLKHGAVFPKDATYWDTLLASWMLEPWKTSHALIVKEHAHRADADAEAAYKLFNEQYEHFEPCCEGLDYDLTVLVDCLFKDPCRLSRIDGRVYPEPAWKGAHHLAIYPSVRATALAWHKGVHTRLLSSSNRILDPLLVSNICRRVAIEVGSLRAKIVSVLVSDAVMNEVEVRLSYLPLWLVDEALRAALLVAHEGRDDYDELEGDFTVYVAEDLFALSHDEILKALQDDTAITGTLGEIGAAWLKARKRYLHETDVRKQYPNAEKGFAGRTLKAVADGSINYNGWLLYEPPGLHEATSSWIMLPAIPEWLTDLYADKEYGRVPGDSVWLPRWRDGDLASLDLERVFGSPDSVNRQLYLEEIAHCLLNLRKYCPDDRLLLIAMKWPAEAEIMQRMFLQLGLSADSGYLRTPLRRLEYALNHGKTIIACEHGDIAKYADAAELLDCPLVVAFDELPLHEWYALMHPPDHVSKVMEDACVSDGGDDAIDREYDVDGSVGEPAREKMVAIGVTLKAPEIRDAVSTFLEGWLQGTLGRSPNGRLECIILDTRFADRGIAKASQLQSKDVGFYSLGELLMEAELEIFNEICFPRRQTQKAPDDYESYRRYLQAHWGDDYTDFRPGIQQDAIRSIADTQHDLLIRMPTGGGKSILFHLPSLFRSEYSGKLTIVITPLRALMRDQVEGLWNKQFNESVDYLSGGRDPWINQTVYQGILDGRIRLVFVAPERFRVSRFIDTLERRRRIDGGLEFIVFDEAHCISQWGFEFRPDYLYAARYVAEWFKREPLPGNPHRILLTSATVTQSNRTDIMCELDLGRNEEYEELPKDMPHPIQPYIIIESIDADEGQEFNDDGLYPRDGKFHEIIAIIKQVDLDKSGILVFVRRRKDCHMLSDALNAYAEEEMSGLEELHAQPFHSGLSESIKESAVELFKNNEVNVLVCTKAFGMGMDIPHVHACIHHRPPTFIEDYLQEVGRTGRDEAKRVEAGHELVKATLLYNSDDFQRNLTQLYESFVKPSDLKELFDYCLEKASYFDEYGESLFLVPAALNTETLDYDEVKVSSTLFWLERMGVLEIAGSVPPTLKIRVDMPKLGRISRGNTRTLRVAAALRSILDETDKAVANPPAADPEKNQTPQAKTAFGRFIKGVLRGALALINRAPEPAEKLQASALMGLSVRRLDDTSFEADIPINQVIAESGILNIDDLFAALIDLVKSGAVSSIERTFHVSANQLPSGEEFWKLLEEALGRLIEPVPGEKRVRYLYRKRFVQDLRSWYERLLMEHEPAIQDKNAKAQLRRRVRLEVYRAVKVSVMLMRYAGTSLLEKLSDSYEPVYVYSITEEAMSSIRHAVDTNLSSMHDIMSVLPNLENEGCKDIRLSDLLAQIKDEAPISALKKGINLIEAAGFYFFEGQVDQWGSLVKLKTKNKLESYRPDDESNVIQKVYADLIRKSEFQVLRAQGMLLLASMPAEGRKAFIDRYFACEKLDALRQLLEDTVGEVDDEVLQGNTMLQELLVHVRQERFDKEMAMLNENQARVCIASFDRRLQVNAGPGSGKTYLLTMRCAHLIHKQKLAPKDILVLAFNRAVVYEIKDRIRSLFHELGYGNYARKLDVSTFHAFALRYQQSTDQYEEDAIGEAVHAFAEKIAGDADFAAEVGRRYKAVLVDEFQDMNEDFYAVVNALARYCTGGVMVIGDDDQDILVWNRRQWQKKYGKTCPLEAVAYFDSFKHEFSPEAHALTVNYRSVPEIVDRANRMIENVPARIGSPRMKSGLALSAHRIEHGETFMPMDQTEYKNAVADALSEKAGSTVAILCRSNRECRQFYEELKGFEPIASHRIELLGAEDFPLYQLRHSGALLDICHTRKGYDFVDLYTWDEIIEEYKASGHADLENGLEYLDSLYRLVREEVGRPRIRDLVAFIEEMKMSDAERLKEKTNQPVEGKLTIATVHKVKGLQYDTVFAMPSSEQFPLNKVDRVEKADAAEEARLCYVAMTRARNRLYIGWGDREKKWIQCEPSPIGVGNQSYALKGSPKEVFGSWCGFEDEVHAGLQNYIESRVSVHDVLRRHGKKLLHKGKWVGLLSKKAMDKINPSSVDLRVANVIRYSCGPYYQTKYPEWYADLHDDVKKQGWLYVVLAEES